MTTQPQTQMTETPESSERQPDLLHDLIAAMAKAEPTATAFDEDGETTDFSELDHLACRIANFLIAYEIEAGDVVAIHQERSVDLFASVLGVLKAGGTYVIVDPTLSDADAADLIDRAGAKLVLGSAKLPSLEEMVGVRVVLVESQHKTFDVFPGQVAFRPSIGPEQASRLTSKGGNLTAVTHGEAATSAEALIAVYGIESTDRCYHDPSTRFALVIEEQLALLAAGATIVLGRPETESPKDCAAFAGANRITFIGWGMAEPRTAATSAKLESSVATSSVKQLILKAKQQGGAIDRFAA